MMVQLIPDWLQYCWGMRPRPVRWVIRCISALPHRITCANTECDQRFWVPGYQNWGYCCPACDLDDIPF